jgi:predicted phosphodiesterase
MRVFALSDVHVDYAENARWIESISCMEYRDDVLILAGDITDKLHLLAWCLDEMVRRFRKVLFVPGNHELWVGRDAGGKTSLQKFHEVCAVVESSGASMQPFHAENLSIVPLLGWYDYSFGEPNEELKSIWMDYYACRWPNGFREPEIAAYFGALNLQRLEGSGKVITFSHFLPRIDLMPDAVPPSKRLLYPVLGSTRLERQLRALAPRIHVYGHSHLNRAVWRDEVLYINNAFGYPGEGSIASKRLLCIHPE